jgi:hypothetical protein
MTGPRTAKMLIPYPHIILGCRPCERLVARRQGDRCRYSPGTCLVTYSDQSMKKRGATRTGGILDFDKLKRHDDETLGSPSTTAGYDRKVPCHFGLAGQGLERFPPEIIRCADPRLLRQVATHDGEGNSQFYSALGCFEK